MTESERRPTNLGAKRCSAWLSKCKELGWLPSQMGMLCDLWWEYHDDNGNLTPEALKSYREICTKFEALARSGEKKHG